MNDYKVEISYLDDKGFHEIKNIYISQENVEDVVFEVEQKIAYKDLQIINITKL